MWSNLPFDVLANIFSFLSPDSLARARSACKNWNLCSKTCNSFNLSASRPHSTHQPWFLGLPIRNQKPCCYAHNPVLNNWYELSLEFLPVPVRAVSPIGSLLLLKVSHSITLQLAICNPFSRQFRYLPQLNISRTNPAVGVVVLNQGVQFPSFRIYVAGGMSEATQGGGATYERTTEMYDSQLDEWRIVGSMPVEFAVRLTVWTPNESVRIENVLYWITSARVYSVIGFDIATNTWEELSVPMAEMLEFATLVRRNGVLGLVGGTSGGDACIWEMKEGKVWGLKNKVPGELGWKLLGGNKRNWDGTKCVGNDEAICLYRDLGSGMVVWRGVRNESSEWEWNWVEGCDCIKGKKVHRCSIRGILIHPSLASTCIF
ncbi:F-box/kelch-repeat protein At5g15710-like [Neltuma alba]|uniref:F-box/kelch-repeat protein At5g15710-like n=1 Tax=Neltuma alba TaxID=207710 RepID=UPI0010A3EF9F|nr:F-box/kelch-repeat protein At5g15710-like [Prosopis alba]